MRSCRGEPRQPRTPSPQLPAPPEPPVSPPLSVPDEYRCGKALGPVESIQEHPRDGGRLLIGYSRGLVALWEQSTRTVQHLFLGNQVLGLLGEQGRLWPRVSPPILSVNPLMCPCSSWRAWPGSRAGRASSAPTATAGTWCGRWVTPARGPTSPSCPPFPTVQGGGDLGALGADHPVPAPVLQVQGVNLYFRSISMQSHQQNPLADLRVGVCPCGMGGCCSGMNPPSSRAELVMGTGQGDMGCEGRCPMGYGV